MIFPSSSAWGSLNDAVAAGLLRASTLSSTGSSLPQVDSQSQRKRSVDQSGDVWAPHRAQMQKFLRQQNPVSTPGAASSQWTPHSNMEGQHATQQQRIDVAGAIAPKMSKAYTWPVRQKGTSSEQCMRQALSSLKNSVDARVRSDTLSASREHVNLSRLLAVELPEVADGPVAVSRPLVDDDSSFVSSRTVRVRHRLDDLVELALDHASADRQRGRNQTGVRAWFSFCEDLMGTPANRPLDPHQASLWEKLEDEWLAMRFVCALVQDKGITPQSAYVYFCCVQGWHAREHGVKLAGGLKLERLPQMLKGLKRIVGGAPRRVRRGVAPQMLQRAMDLLLDPTVPAHANIRAALAVALQGLLRSAEYTSKTGKVDVDHTMMRSDIAELNAERAVLMMAPCKNMHHLGGKTCPLVIGAGGEFVDSIKELHNLLRVDPVPEHLRASTPLFREPATNSPLRYDVINGWIKRLMVAVGENPDEFATHSMRIGGATALFAAGANETVIRTMGRWSSDLHRLYVRACFEQCCAWSKQAGSQVVSDLSGTFDEVDDY